MSPLEIRYDATNNVFVIRKLNPRGVGDNPYDVIGACSAELAQRGQLPDEKAAKVGIRRFVSFADWQGAVAGHRLTTKTPEELMNDPAARL